MFPCLMVPVLNGSFLVGLFKLLLALTSTVILGSRSHRTHDHIFLFHDSESHASTLSSGSHWLSLIALTWMD
jgi:hypothetical protein